MFCKITVRAGENTAVIRAESGGTALSLLREAGKISAPCGGNGRCGKCRIKIRGKLSAPDETEKRLLTPRELASGLRLACRARVLGDCEARLPAEPENFRAASCEEKRAGAPAGRVGVAADIGTTTVAAWFVDLDTGAVLGEESGLNAQRGFGADVMSRAGACREPGSAAALHGAIIGQLNGFTARFCESTGAKPEQFASFSFAGNTVMQHLLAGLSPAGMAAAPFSPVSLFGESLPADKLGLCCAAGSRAYFVPCVSAFVGGDVTAGLLACGEPESPRLFLDVGTNGEAALFFGGRFLCCSAAAGPAFEGAHIRWGTGGVPGAVCSVNVREGRLRVGTIGGQKPVGICGSGLIDALAVMRELGVMDETGRIVPGPRVAEAKDGGLCFVLDEEAGVCVTQKDVREAQLAKAAVAAGVLCLLREAGIPENAEIPVLLAGGFGSHLNGENARKIGLLPGSGPVTAVGNAAGRGAVRALLSSESRKALKNLAARCETVNLSGSAYFNRLFMERMTF